MVTMHGILKYGSVLKNHLTKCLESSILNLTGACEMEAG